MPLVFTKDHTEAGVTFSRGQLCPRGFPHPRKRALVGEGVLRKVPDAEIVPADPEPQAEDPREER